MGSHPTRRLGLVNDIELEPGAVVRVLLHPVFRRGQGGRRPAVVAWKGCLAAVHEAVTVVPVTAVDR